MVARTSSQLGNSCTATIQNRSVQLNPDGTFAIGNTPVDQGLFRVHIVCKNLDGSITGGQSDFFSLTANGESKVPKINLGVIDPAPVSIAVTAPLLTLGAAGQALEEIIARNAKSVVVAQSVNGTEESLPVVDVSLGSADAPLKIEWFADLGSPLTARSFVSLQQFLAAHKGTAQVSFRNFLLTSRCPGQILADSEPTANCTSKNSRPERTEALHLTRTTG